jgi:hypothetical protein
MIGDIILYQFGSYKFTRLSTDQSFTRSVKTQYETGPNMDGDIRKNGIIRNKLGALSYSMSFLIDDSDDQNVIRKQFFSEPQPIFFVQDFGDKLKFFVNYADCLSLDVNYKAMQPLGAGKKVLSAEFKLMFPYFYEIIDDDLQYIDYSNAQNLLYDSGSNYDSGNRFDRFYVSTRKHFSSLTQAQIVDSFGRLVFSPEYLLEWTDRFLLYLNKSAKKYNYLANSKNITTSSWTKSAFATVSLNGGKYLKYNLTQKMQANAFPQIVSLNQSGLTMPTGIIAWSFDIRRDTGSTFTQFRALIEWNGGASSVNSGLRNVASLTQTAISGGTIEIKDLGDSWFRVILRATAYTQFSDVNVIFRWQSGALADIVYLENLTLYSETIAGTPVYDANLSDYFNSQNALTYVLNSNSQTSLFTYPMDLSGNATNTKLMLFISSMSQNNYITITNGGSGILFTWKSSAASPNLILDVQNMLLYNANNGTPISPYSGLWTCVSIGQILKLDSTLTINVKEPINQVPTILVQKNSSSNITFSLKNYKTYV